MCIWSREHQTSRHVSEPEIGLSRENGNDSTLK
jgi:hypothetical protein